ncbi:hypothetical protein KUTeg_000033 [Tegillarca granosa]|uniref:Uncharacterized protein n=1 Tax=Tegillarca granosa TaxID=220873 RepID=A0ABQ9FYY7_TEGGR|nr:hypothetical protein KUTeg_000033 [Tegillarca granosa]
MYRWNGFRLIIIIIGINNFGAKITTWYVTVIVLTQKNTDSCLCTYSYSGVFMKDDDVVKRLCRLEFGNTLSVLSKLQIVRQILVKFTRYNLKRKIMKSRWELKKNSSSKDIFINEDLTKRRQSIYTKARQLYKAKLINKT